MTRASHAPTVTVIGAGSASFGMNTLATIMRSPYLKGSHINLVDLDEHALKRIRGVAERMNQAWAAQMTICATTDRRTVLDGADFVVVSIEVTPREKLWRLDWEIPVRHGLRQPYGENGGPGGMMHTFRQVPPLLAIARDMEEQCPAAWLINFSNPLPRLTRAVTKHTGIRAVGKCHQIDVAYAIVAVLLREEYGFDVPQGISMSSNTAGIAAKHRLAHAAREHFIIKAAGLNHFSWIVDVRDRHSGEDLYPRLRKARSQAPPEFEPLTMDLFQIFGYCPVPGDTHLAEYLPWTHDPISKPWERYGLALYDWSGNEALREDSNLRLGQIARGQVTVDGMLDAPSEGAAEIIEAVSCNLNRYEEAVNLPNRGAIPGLPEGTIVEVPALVAGSGIHGLQLAPLPEPIAELCRREAALVEMIVDAAVHGDRTLALQALCLDPMINDLTRARLILDDYLETFADYLPQFH